MMLRPNEALTGSTSNGKSGFGDQGRDLCGVASDRDAFEPTQIRASTSCLHRKCGHTQGSERPVCL
jgi:hypothetical protein